MMAASKPTLSAARYLTRLLIALLIAVTSLAAFNWLINPYQLFSSPTLPNINAFKTRFFYYQLIGKPYQLRKQQPDTVIFGSSRAGASLQASHPAHSEHQAFNFALAGSSAAIQWLSFEHAVNATSVKRAILPLDLFMFNACVDQTYEPPYRNYAQRIAGQAVGWQYPQRWLIDHASALLGLNTTYESWLTLKSQRQFTQSQAGLMHLQKDGHWQNLPADNTPQRSLFHYIENQNLRSGWYPASCYATQSRPAQPGDAATPLETIEKIIDHAHKHRIKLHIFFSPFHARLAEAMDAAELWETFEELKRSLVRINERSALAHVEPQTPFPVWDFSGYSSINTEPVPARGDVTSRMQWHRDATHVTPATGDILQSRIFGLPIAAEFEFFGQRIDNTSLEKWLESDRMRRRSYREQHPADVAEIRELAKRARAWQEKHPRTAIPSWLK